MILDRNNIEQKIAELEDAVKQIPLNISAPDFKQLAFKLKRAPARCGPYPDVSIFEGMNRIMSDFVILYGIQGMLNGTLPGTIKLPFDSYEVMLGTDHQKPFDIIAEANGHTLIGEAFNVSPKFFQAKKTASLKKLRNAEFQVNYKIILCNSGSIPESYTSNLEPPEFIFFVDGY